MVQIPEAMKVAVVPETVQTDAVVEAKLTAKPELAVATIARGVPTVCVLGALKVMVCAPMVTAKLCNTGAAAAQAELPACLTSMVQLPVATNEAVAPETVQIEVVSETKVTAKPELAVAASVSGVPTVWALGALKVLVCAWPTTAKFFATAVAAA